MDVTFEGGPFHGQTHTIDPEPAPQAVVYWPPDSHPVDGGDIPGQVGVTEYLYQGNGKAAYVGGLMDPGSVPQPGPLAGDKSGATAEPGHPQPAGAEVESARLLEADAAGRMGEEEIPRDELRRLADEFIALDLGTGTDEFVEWVRHQRSGSEPTEHEVASASEGDQDRLADRI
jgi:hypothetical protein